MLYSKFYCCEFVGPPHNCQTVPSIDIRALKAYWHWRSEAANAER